MSKTLHHKNTSTSISEGLLQGVTWWVVFSVAAVILRGVRWDENFEFAQAMIGAVPYPPEHPFMQYTHAAFNGQIMASAALLEIFPHPAVLNGLRNILFVMAATVPGYMLGHVMGRRPLAGHVTALMLLIGVHLDFDATYPQFIWPGMFSNGHIGTGYVLAWVALTSAGYFRMAALMLGLLPAVHLGQMPPTLIFAGGLTGYALLLNRDLWGRMKPGIPWFLGGLAVCVLLYGIHHTFALPPVTEGPYFSNADPQPIWQGRVRYWDMHRQIALGGMGMILVFSASLGVVLRNRKNMTGSVNGLSPFLPLLYGLGCVAPLVLTLMILHGAAGLEVPYLLIGWLPYRLLNHLPPILTAACVAVLMGRGTNESDTKWSGNWIPGLLLLGYLLRPVAGWVLGDGLYYRYIHQPIAFLFILAGAAFVLAANRFIQEGSKDSWIVPTLTGVVAVTYTAMHHQFGAACLLLGAGLVVILNRAPNVRAWNKTVAPMTSVLIILTLGTILLQEWQHRENLPIGAFEQDVTAYLESQGKPDAMLVGQPEQVLLQAQTGHPILADMATAFFASYMPSLGPSVQKLYGEVYGMQFDKNPADQKPWGTMWEERSKEVWISLSQEYGFDYVVAPSHLQLQLDSVIEGELDRLYKIPGK